MIPTGNITPTSGNIKSSLKGPVEKGNTSPRKVTASVSEDSDQEKPFKKILSKKMADDKKEPVKVATPAEEGDEPSLFDLVVQGSAKRSSTTQKPKPTTPTMQYVPPAPDTSQTLPTKKQMPKAELPKTQLPESGEETPEMIALQETALQETALQETALQETALQDTVPVKPKVTLSPEVPQEPKPVVVLPKQDVTQKPVETPKPEETPKKDAPVKDAQVEVPVAISQKDKETQPMPDVVQVGSLIAGSQIPTPTPVVAPVVETPKQPVTQTRETLVKLYEQMVAQLDQITSPGKVDTTITLQYPPLFQDAQVTITEYTTAQKQFNVTFSNIQDPAALALISQQSNQNMLRNELIAKGYTLQQITVEQPKIPGLQSLDAGEVTLGKRRQSDEEAAGGDEAGANFA